MPLPQRQIDATDLQIDRLAYELYEGVGRIGNPTHRHPCRRVDRQIACLVCELYGLSEEEIATVEEATK